MGTPKSMSRIILFVVTRSPPSRQIRAAAVDGGYQVTLVLLFCAMAPSFWTLLVTTFIETETVRHVYFSMESLFLAVNRSPAIS